jgi:hypothetical protein
MATMEFKFIFIWEINNRTPIFYKSRVDTIKEIALTKGKLYISKLFYHNFVFKIQKSF